MITTKKIANIPILPIQKGKLNIYSPEQIKRVGGIENFLDLVALKEPINIPDLGFTEEQWDEMEKLLRDDS
ncbi:MAG: hypothetical protein MUF45_08985 [Spirosomaceae bacterium]|jgi:hypothetical protein|nr:hypothetical protein [Spirosomataceae bacterium]